jgi:hypothetical protein
MMQPFHHSYIQRTKKAPYVRGHLTTLNQRAKVESVGTPTNAHEERRDATRGVFRLFGAFGSRATERVPDATIMTVMGLSSIYLLLRTRGKVIFPLLAKENALYCLSQSMFRRSSAFFSRF